MICCALACTSRWQLKTVVILNFPIRIDRFLGSSNLFGLTVTEWYRHRMDWAWVH